jgi:hypothetical protein
MLPRGHIPTQHSDECTQDDSNHSYDRGTHANAG